MNYTFNVPTKVLFGAGRLDDLHCEKMPGKKALIVISNGKSTKANGYLERTEAELKAAGADYVVFDKIQPNPLKETVEEGAEFARKNGCDFIVALGGGSVMDASKAIALNTVNEGDLWDYVHSGSGKGKALLRTPLPIIAITTTAGTGSEVDFGGVITKSDTHEKIGICFPELTPVLAVVDPALMTTVPPKYTAYQGFDALFHSIEGYLSVHRNLMSEMVQEAAISNLAEYLPRAVADGSDIEAREHVAFANTMSGYSMMVGSCTSEHSMEHAMSAYHQDLPHGAGLIMISVEYYRHFINCHACDERFVKMAKLLGIRNASQPQEFITALENLQKACGVYGLKMSDYGIREDEFDLLAKNARETMGGLFACDPVALSQEDCVAIYRKSFR